MALWQLYIVPTWSWDLLGLLLSLGQIAPEDYLITIEAERRRSRFLAAEAEGLINIVGSWWGRMVLGCQENLLPIPHSSRFGLNSRGKVVFHFSLTDWGRSYSRLILRKRVPLPKERTTLEVELLRL
jgi:hypothetical protein